jgi:hypothetical protein
MVTYTEYFKGGAFTKWIERACFLESFLGENQTIRIVYSCECYQPLKKEHIEKYCSFLTEWLDSKYFKYTISQEAPFIINWDLDTSEMDKKKALLYLVAFRYLSEFPRYVMAIGSSQLKTSEENFLFFQQCHTDSLSYTTNQGCFESANSEHSLRCFYPIRQSDIKTISIKEFQENCKTNGVSRMTDYWKKKIDIAQ